MPKPRIFVSSTFYDLRYVRASLGRFIDSLGYEPVLSENGSIAYVSDQSLDESCYRAVQDCDIFVLIMGRRYGSPASDASASLPPSFFERYDSITRREYRAAMERDIPIYVLINRDVFSEFLTYQNNRDNDSVRYAHVDSVNVFQFIEEIQVNNKPIRTFDEYNEVEEWLRLQWAGFFRELLHRRELLPRVSNQRDSDAPATQSSEIADVIKTLQRVLEEGITRLSPEETASISNVIRAASSTSTDENQIEKKDT
jgi:hypothetical protein